MSTRDRVIDVKYGWLKGRLELLSPSARAAFAAGCAQRLLPSYHRLSMKLQTLRSFDLDCIFRELWLDLCGVRKMRPLALGQAMRSCLEALESARAEINQFVVPPREYTAGENAASALFFSLKCHHSGEVLDAIWAAASAHAALDHYVILSTGIDTNASGGEERVLSHPLVQAEFDRQLRDVEELREGTVTVGQLRERAEQEGAIFMPEWQDMDNTSRPV